MADTEPAAPQSERRPRNFGQYDQWESGCIHDTERYIREEQGDDESEAQSQSHIVPLVNAADRVQLSVPRRD